MTDQRDMLAREIDEELRREQLLKLWEQYGTYVIVVFGLIIVGIGGFKYWEHRRTVAAEAAGARFVAATRMTAQDKRAEAEKALEEIAAAGPGGYGALARLRVAANEQAAGKTAEAIASYEAIAKQGGVDALISDYARLQAAMLRLDSSGWTEMQNRLNDLAADGNPWRFSAWEVLGLAAYKAGKMDEARQQFQRLLSDRNTPVGIGERARILMAMLVEAELAAAAPAPAAEKAAPVEKAPAAPEESGGQKKTKASDKPGDKKSK
jgi:hypothetical protein